MLKRMLLAAAVFGALAIAGLGSGEAARTSVKFTVTALPRPEGYSEPSVTVGADGTMAIAALAWQHDQAYAGAWKGPFGSVPVFQGPIDAGVPFNPNSDVTFGGSDVDIDLGSTGTLHASTLMQRDNNFQAGISAITCPNADTSDGFSHCTKQFIDHAGADRQWITSDGPTVYLAYHDAGSSGTIHVQRSDDDGFTWKRVADPIVGEGSSTGGATFNNSIGPIVVDPRTDSVYISYVAGSPGVTKAQEVLLNKVYVARSNNRGMSWTSTLVYEGPSDVTLDNFWPTAEVDPATGVVYTAWTDRQEVLFSSSHDHGISWSSPVVISEAPVRTTVMPWVAAYNNVVDVVYYGTDAATIDDPALTVADTAVWDVYLAQSTDGGANFAQTRVSPKPNHLGPVCLLGSDCIAYRQLLDLFEVDIDARTGRSVITYTSDNLGHPLTVTSGPNKGDQFPTAAEGRFTRSILLLPDEELDGPTTYVGTAGCDGAAAPTAPANTDANIDQIALILSSPGCRFDAQVKAVLDAGYEGFVLLLSNRAVDVMCNGGYRDLPGMCVKGTSALALLGVSDFSQVAVGSKGPNLSVGPRRPQLIIAQQTQ